VRLCQSRSGSSDLLGKADHGSAEIYRQDLVAEEVHTALTYPMTSSLGILGVLMFWMLI
jgi:hypothetical protein